jgi:hypothetical protein
VAGIDSILELVRVLYCIVLYCIVHNFLIRLNARTSIYCFNFSIWILSRPGNGVAYKDGVFGLNIGFIGHLPLTVLNWNVLTMLSPSWTASSCFLLSCLELFPITDSPAVEAEVHVKLRPTVSGPVYRGVRHLPGAHDQIFVFWLTIAGVLMWGGLSDERMDLIYSYNCFWVLSEQPRSGPSPTELTATSYLLSH